ncbi:MAG: response regulator [Candidatus Wallbacteria bacterium]|nr:response regulator [Candidatus Wallbacteria bacterium]MBI4866263.1 response regulator [Candidatus Wallbacteria bacterium]
MKILIIDDEPGICDMLVEMCQLESEDFRVEQAQSAEEAYQKICDARYDIIISDVKMRNMDGVELYHKIHAENRGGMPFVFLSGTPETFWKIPKDAKFFEKPVKLRILFDYIKEVASQHQASTH